MRKAVLGSSDALRARVCVWTSGECGLLCMRGRSITNDAGTCFARDPRVCGRVECVPLTLGMYVVVVCVFRSSATLACPVFSWLCCVVFSRSICGKTLCRVVVVLHSALFRMSA